MTTLNPEYQGGILDSFWQQFWPQILISWAIVFAVASILLLLEQTGSLLWWMGAIFFSSTVSIVIIFALDVMKDDKK